MSTIINSEKVDNIEELLPSFKFVFNEEGVEQIVSDKDLNSLEAAEGFANKEFLLNAHDMQTITFKTYARGLNINDVISIILPEYKIPIDRTKNRLIVTEISTEYVGAKTLDIIKGVRYDK